MYHVAGLPVFLSHPQDQFVNNSDKVTFECSANGSDSLHISWIKNSKSYTEGNITTRHHSSKLTINNATVADSGEYQCNATNADGNSTKSYKAELIST